MLASTLNPHTRVLTNADLGAALLTSAPRTLPHTLSRTHTHGQATVETT